MTKRVVGVLTLLVWALPLAAGAHALPVSTNPEVSGVVARAPQIVSITFSEHVDPSGSSVRVIGPTGALVSGASTISQDGKTISTPLSGNSVGAYTVSWSTTSADDGHFTSGSYSFLVGSAAGTTLPAISSVIVSQTSLVPEAQGSALELAGNGLIWATLLVLMLCIRPLLRTGRYAGDERAVRAIYLSLLGVGFALALGGGLTQLVIKSSQLEHIGTLGLTFAQAFALYSKSVAGLATIYRLVIIGVCAVVLVVGRNRIVSAPKVTYYEIVMIVAMLAFAYFRGSISHVVSEASLPSVVVATINALHLIVTDLLFGVPAVLVVLYQQERLRGLMRDALSRSLALFGAALATLTLTGAFIVTVLLKDFSNLTTTDWGRGLLKLGAVFVALTLTYALLVLSRRFRATTFERWGYITLLGMSGLGATLVYLSALMIVTPTPAEKILPQNFSTESHGVTITLGKSLYEDGMVELKVAGSNNKDLATPSVTIDERRVVLAQRSLDGYVFPRALMTGPGPYTVAIDVPQQDGYDALATFVVPATALDSATSGASPFVFEMLALSLFACALILGLLYVARRTVGGLVLRMRGGIVSTGLVVTALCGVFGVAALADMSGVLNPYKAECEADGNVWHLMQPMRAGVATSQHSVEGCMWGMGNFMYQFATKAEYDYYRSLPKANVTLSTIPTRLVAGVPTTFTVSLQDGDKPAPLFVDMDKLLHVVVISKDETVFAHIHPDDNHPLTDDEIKNSTFDLVYTFPKAGEYTILIDYAHGLTLESKQFTVQVADGPTQQNKTALYESPGKFGGYDVALKYALPLADEVTTLSYTITKNGQPVIDLRQYLSAAAHVVVVKNDLSWYTHIHGEVHPPGTTPPPVMVKNGQVVHSMASMMYMPQTFGPNVEAHLIFPSRGRYTVWAQFNIAGTVIPTSFTVDVE